jgi:transcriptional regulator with XRE-family HTH domain
MISYDKSKRRYNQSKLSELLQVHAKKKNTYQLKMAEELGITRCYFNTFYNGKNPLPPSNALIDRMAEMLKYDRLDLYAICNKTPSEVHKKFVESRKESIEK